MKYVAMSLVLASACVQPRTAPMPRREALYERVAETLVEADFTAIGTDYSMEYAPGRWRLTGSVGRKVLKCDHRFLPQHANECLQENDQGTSAIEPPRQP